MGRNRTAQVKFVQINTCQAPGLLTGASKQLLSSGKVLGLGFERAARSGVLWV